MAPSALIEPIRQRSESCRRERAFPPCLIAREQHTRHDRSSQQAVRKDHRLRHPGGHVPAADHGAVDAPAAKIVDSLHRPDDALSLLGAFSQRPRQGHPQARADPPALTLMKQVPDCRHPAHHRSIAWAFFPLLEPARTAARLRCPRRRWEACCLATASRRRTGSARGARSTSGRR